METTALPASAQSKGDAQWAWLNSTNLKLLAVLLMVLDHVHQMFAAFGAPLWLTMAGRLVFPLFLFTLAEGFHYTHSKKRYLLRLLAASWAMTLFTLLLQRAIPNEHVVLMNNAFSTLFMAGLYMLFWDWLAAGIRQKQPRLIAGALLASLAPILCALPTLLLGLLALQPGVPLWVIQLLAAISLFIPNILTVEGGFAMVLLGVLFYVFRQQRALQIAALLIVSAASLATGGGIQVLMGLAAIPMALYNGQRGRGMKYFFYIFYPAHLGLLYLISAHLA